MRRVMVLILTGAMAAGAFAAEPDGNLAQAAAGNQLLLFADVVEADRMAASVETVGELRKLLTDGIWIRRFRTDPLTLQFLRERFTGSPVVLVSGMSRDYVDWLFETVLLYGDRMASEAAIPDFRLAPAMQAPSWGKVWSRSFGPFLKGQATSARAIVVTRPHAVIRASSAAKSKTVGRAPAGSELLIRDMSGSAYLVEYRGISGYVNATDLSVIPTPQPMRSDALMLDWSLGTETGTARAPWSR